MYPGKQEDSEELRQELNENTQICIPAASTGLTEAERRCLRERWPALLNITSHDVRVNNQHLMPRLENDPV